MRFTLPLCAFVANVVTTENITPSAGPNGSEEFLNCGVEGAGWTPPPLKVKDVIARDLSDALQDPNSPLKNCKPYVSLFEQYGNQFGGKQELIGSEW